jgi:hypothetical protein
VNAIVWNKIKWVEIENDLFEWDQVGQELKGVLISKEEKYFKLQADNGKFENVYFGTVLKRKLKNVEPMTILKIIYLGEEMSSSESYSSYKNFKVEKGLIE